ncbi:peptidase domain-containing ABC transporter [Namhaeicola litoreus]|uniref:Peptidase domain-containing ABC transporter n=1 Tax=Namhaeicola litoreus TaxID=1052145 RepID=A0ABW3Y317_9FLAO
MSNTKMTPWERLMGLITLEKKDILQIFYYAVFNGIVALSLPLGIQSIINLIQGAQISTSWIVLVILVTVGTAFSGALGFMQIRILETIQQRIFTRSSFDFTYRFPKIKTSELFNYYPPELANRFFDTLMVQKGLSKIIIDIPTAVLQIIFALLLLSFYHPVFIIFGLFLLILIVVVFRYTAKKGLDTSLEESKAKYKVAHWIQEVARAVISFKFSGRTNLALNKNDLLVDSYLNAREGHFSILRLQYFLMIAFKVIVTASLLLIGGGLVLNQQMNIGQFVAAEIIILLVIASVEKLIIGLESVYDVLTSIEKIGHVVDKELEPHDGERPDFSKTFQIELNKASYGVPNREKFILKDISLMVDTTTRMLVDGECGSGKSSLFNLISGVLEPTGGHVYVNNHSITSLYLNYYRAHLGLSLSEETPFEGTLRENVTFGDLSISDDRIFEVFEKIGLMSFIRDLRMGLNTVLYPEGKRISKTVAKKIILARALLKNPKVLILEEPLDEFNTEELEEIVKYLADKSHPWGLMVISANPIWKKYMKEHLTLEDGEIKTFKS